MAEHMAPVSAGLVPGVPVSSRSRERGEYKSRSPALLSCTGVSWVRLFGHPTALATLDARIPRLRSVLVARHGPVAAIVPRLCWACSVRAPTRYGCGEDPATTIISGLRFARRAIRSIASSADAWIARLWRVLAKTARKV